MFSCVLLLVVCVCVFFFFCQEEKPFLNFFQTNFCLLLLAAMSNEVYRWLDHSKEDMVRTTTLFFTISFANLWFLLSGMFDPT